MKKMISLIISASIFLQMIIPAVNTVTYAQTGDLHGLKWEKNKSLDRRLKEHGVKTGEREALISWKLDDVTGSYILEYFVENEEIVEDDGSLGNAEKIQLTFNRVTIGNNATVGVKVFGPSDEDISGDKVYKKFSIDDDDWVSMGSDDLIPLVKGSTYPGGSIFIGTQMEIRFKWVDDTIYVQTNAIKSGNITPFRLRHGTMHGGKPDKIEVLTGLEGYKVSPIHIELKDEKITDKKVIAMPGEDPPGSKPGVQIEFRRPRSFDETTFNFGDISDEDAIAIKASLEIKDSINQPGQLTFNLGEASSVIGLGNTGKMWQRTEKTYKLYLAEDDKIDGIEHDNIIKWDALQGSLIFNEINLSLSREKEAGPVQALGIFKPIEKDKDGDIGRYTYLKYTIKRSSLQDAYIEIYPYRTAANTDFTYSVQVAGDGSNWETLVEHKYTTTDTGNYSPITVPVPFSETYVERSYKIVAKYSQGTINSQELRYNPKEDLTIPPPTPLIQGIDNIYVVPSMEEEGSPETIGFDLTWSAPRNSSDNKVLDGLLDKGNLYYELVLYDTPEALEGTGTLIKVFKVSKEATPGSQIKVEPYGGTAGKKDAQGNDLPVIRHNPSKNTFTMENVVLKNLQSTQDGWEQIVGMPPDYDNAETINRYPVITEEMVNHGLVDKEVPGIYYLTMRGLYEPNASGEPTISMGISNESTPKSITISLLKEVIPVPTKIESTQLLDEQGLDIIRQSFSWGNVDLTRYIRQMLEPLNLSIGEGKERTYEIYLYQKKNIQESELTDITTPSGITLELPNKYKLKDRDIEKLRDKEVLRFDYKGSINAEMNNIVFEGLDANQVYYTKIRVRLDLKDNENHAVESRHSVFSKEHNFTTYVKPSEPGVGERVPPVPEELTIVEQINNTTATIGWKAPNYSTQEGERLYYEMIRVDSRKLAKEEDSRLVSIRDLINRDTKNEITAWHTQKDYIDEYERSTGSWSKMDNEQLSSKLQLEDDGLSPNSIYYYYVRTVLVIDGEGVYSSWVGIPVTTDPIQKPIRLKVENTEAYPHDPKREIVISFLAPIHKGAQIPSEYDFDIAVQGELDEDYRLDYPTTRLTSAEDDKDVPAGYTHFVYKISNAKPGKRYDIKVRVIDKVVHMVDGQYPKSLYSDRVTTRTHFDQDEQDKEDKFAEYLKYFEDKVEALRRKPYWALEDGSSEFSIKYRSNYIIPGINNFKTYPLDVREGVTDFTYYIPASVIASANLNQTSFEIKQGSVTYSVRPSTITTELEELKVTLEDISAKRIRDYYVVFYFQQIPQAISLGADGFLTPKIIVDIELMRLKEEDLFLEDDMMIALNNEINSEKTVFIGELEKALERGRILNEDLDIIIDRSMAVIEKRHQKEVRSILKRNTSKILPIGQWNKDLLIMATIEGNAIAQGYMLGWQEIELPTFNVAGGYGLEATRAGTYAFKGQRIVMPVIPGVSGANNLIAKYQLTDFFGTNGVINPNNMAIKKDVLGAIARVLGAPRGADYIQYLKQRNMKGITNIGMNLPMKKGEGIYLLMQVYEINLKKPIGSVYIKNRNIVPNIRSFNSIHQPYITVAADANMIHIGSGIRPNDTMQIKDVLQMLTNIMTGLR